MLTMKTLREQIRRDLLLVTDYVKRSVKQDMTDINRYAEDFYCGLLNTAFGWGLRNLNREKKNHPAIDLADDENRIGIQVTSTETRGKITHTLKKFFEDGLDAKYKRLIVLVMGTEEPFRDPFKVERGFDFDPDRDIWDTPRLTDKLENIENIDILKQVAEYLQKHLDIPRQVVRPLNLPVPEFRSAVGFLGRQKELDEIRRELPRTKPVILAGLGGVGKTMLASHFAKDWPGTALFVRFDGSFTRTLADGVGRHIPPEQRKGLDEAAVAELALELLRQYSADDLLMMDNAEVDGTTWRELTQDPCYAKLRLLPMRLLMTTRLRDTGGIWIGNLEHEELRQIFRGHDADVPEPMMDELIRAVGGHTMTVDMIARTIRESWGDVTPETILTAMKNSTLHAADFDEIENDHDPEQRQIYAHLKALFNLSGISEDGKQALRCATLLPEDGMNAKLFRDALPEGPRDEIKKLEKRGWVDLENGILKIHPVVRLVCRTELEPTDENCEDFLIEIAKQYDRKQYDIAKFYQLAELFETAAKLPEENERWAMAAGHLWSKVGEPERALNLELWAMKLLEQKQTDSEFLALGYNNVGMAYGELGDYEKALECILNALTIRERILPDDHLDLGVSYNSVGRIYSACGNFDKALRYHIKALDICERVFNEDHPDLATCYNNVGSSYGDLGNHKQALEYKKKAMEMWERVLPVNHPELALSYNSMSVTYSAQGDYEKTLEYLLKALAIQERTLHENHPDLAQSYNNLGYAYGAVGDHEKALKYQMKTLAICERTLLGSHPHYAVSCNNIAWTYYKLRQLDSAAQYMRRAADIINRSTLPEGHSDRVNYTRWAELFEREARQVQGTE